MKYYFIDLFCGAGGVTTGVHRAQYDGENIAEVIACVNHDATAISTHAANHPDVLHYTEDIRTLDLTELAAQVQLTRLKDADAVICLWASLECTNFSKAKGGLPRDADSRTLAEHLFRYIEELNPDMIWIENVEEFMSWGPLDDNGKPLSRHNGRDYTRWVKKVQRYGYQFDHRILNAADYGAYTSRKRFFAQFAKPEIEITWPVQTHAKKLSDISTLFTEGRGLKKWEPVRKVLNLDETGESIFIPGRIKSDKTYERIYAGLQKFVAGGKKEFEAFLAKFNSTGSDGNVKQCSVSIDNPSPTINTHGRLSLVHPVFITKYHSGKDPVKRNRNYSVDEPLNTVDTENRFYCIDPVFIIQRKSGEPLSKLVDVDGPARTITTTGGNQEVVTPQFLMKYFSGDPGSKCISVDEPCGTIRTKDGTAFVSAYYGNGHNCTGVDQPSPTVTGGDRFILVSPQFLYRDFSNGGATQSVDNPSGAVQTNPKLNLLTCEQFLMDTQFGNTSKGIDEPAPTQTSNRKHFYLMNPQWFNTSNASVDEPCFTIIARQDKTPAYLICAETGLCAIEVFENDLPHALLIKAFMVLYGIVDIKMRMLQIIELLRIQGFGDEYILNGSKTKQKWMLGNAVECNQARVLIEASYRGNIVNELKAA